MAYHSESAKVRDMEHVMKYITGSIIDIGCGTDKITPEAIGVDGRDLPGVNVITDDPYDLLGRIGKDHLITEGSYDTVFSSHFLEHLRDQFRAIMGWSKLLKTGGHLVLYLPDGRHYDNKENLEHMLDMNYDQFIFWFQRAFCGVGKDFRGEHLAKLFELVDHALDLGEDRYSFYVICKKV